MKRRNKYKEARKFQHGSKNQQKTPLSTHLHAGRDPLFWEAGIAAGKLETQVVPRQGRRRQLRVRDPPCGAQLQVPPLELISAAPTCSLTEPCPSRGWQEKELRHLHRGLAKEPAGNTRQTAFANCSWKQTQSTPKLPAATRCCTWGTHRCFAKRA